MAPQMEGSFAKGLTLPTGTWTPWAQVLCPRCVDTSNPMWKGDEVEMAERRERDPEEYELQGFCDECGDQIWIPADVAQMQRMAHALRERGIPAALQQTGGMCCAVEVWEPDVEECFLAMVAEGDADTDYPDGWYMELQSNDHSDGIEEGDYVSYTFDDALECAESRFYYLAHLAGGSKNFEEGRVF